MFLINLEEKKEHRIEGWLSIQSKFSVGLLSVSSPGTNAIGFTLLAEQCIYTTTDAVYVDIQKYSVCPLYLDQFFVFLLIWNLT